MLKIFHCFLLQHKDSSEIGAKKNKRKDDEFGYVSHMTLIIHPHISSLSQRLLDIVMN